MNKLIERVVDDMRKSGIDVEMPDWARFKSWERYTIEAGWINTPGNITHAYLSRPAGPDLPIFYANSEISPEDSNHGWVEGAFEAVEMILPDLVKSLLD